MTKKNFYKILKAASGRAVGLIIGNASTERDAAFNRSYDGVYLHYSNTTDKTLIVHKRADTNNVEINKELEKYNRWFAEFKSAKL